MTNPPEKNLMHEVEALQKELEEKRLALATNKNETPKFSFLQSPDCEKNLRKFIDSNLVSIIRVTGDGMMIEANAAAAKMLGYTIEELNQSTLQAEIFTPPEYHELDVVAFEQLQKYGQAKSWEKELLRKDGTRASALVAGVTASGTGDDQELLAFLIDITQKKKILKELKASEEQFKLLAEAIPQLVWICDNKAKATYINQRFYDVTGLSKENDDGFLWLSTVHEEDRKKLLLRASQASKAVEPFESRVRYVTKDGSARWHIVRGIPIRNEKDELQWFGTSTDIDSKVRLQEKISKREKHFRTLANSIPQIVWTANHRGEIDFFNDRWFEYTGLTLDESKNDGWQFLIHPEDRKKYIREWRSALASGDSYEMEFRLKRTTSSNSNSSDEKPSDSEQYRWHLGRAVALRKKDGSISQWFATWTEIESQMTKDEASS